MPFLLRPLFLVALLVAGCGERQNAASSTLARDDVPVLSGRLPFDGAAWDLYPTKDGTGFVAWQCCRAIARFDIREPAALWTREIGASIPGIALAQDGRRFTVSGSSAYLALFDLDSGARVRDFERPEFRDDPFATLAEFSSDDRFLLSGFRDYDGGWLSLWDVESGAHLRYFQDTPAILLRVGILARDRVAFAFGFDALHLWSLETGQLLKRVTLRDLAPNAPGPPPGEALPQRYVGFKAVAFGSDMRIAVVSSGWAMHVIDLENAAVLRTVQLDSGFMIRAVGITSDGETMMAYGAEITNCKDTPGTLAAWSISGEKRYELTSRELGAHCRYRPDVAGAFLADGRSFVMGESAYRGDTGIKLWRLPRP